MAGPDLVKEKILEQADIVDVVSNYIQLQNRGGRFLGLCPFHTEKTPSFNVNPQRGFYHCFGCGTGGNVIDFVMGVENLTYGEARRFLAQKLGIPIESYSNKNRKHADIDRYQVMDLAANFFVKQLSSSTKAIDYLKGRELTGEQAKQFTIGYSPDAWDALETELKRQHIPEAVMIELGLVNKRREGNGCYDFFRDRIMFPIRNTLGRVIAFGGRALSADAQAKYFNSNDTPLFKKSRVLYLLEQAKDVLKDRGAVLVEGYMDAIAMHIAGYTQTVATLGTALTKDHAQILHRYTQEFTLLYDGDGAGIKAAMKGVETFFEAGLTVKAILLPEGQDPDDYIKANGSEAMRQLLENAVDGFAFYLDRAMQGQDVTTPQGKTAIVEAMVPLMARVSETFLLKDYIRQIASLLGSELDPLESAIKDKIKKGHFNKTGVRHDSRYDDRNAPPPDLGADSRPAHEEEEVDPFAQEDPRDAHTILKETLTRLLAYHVGLLTPHGMAQHERPTIFQKNDLCERIPELLKQLGSHPRLDAVIQRLLVDVQAEGDEKNLSGAAQLSALFPETVLRTFFIALLESEPLPNTEKSLKIMVTEILQSLYDADQKSKSEVIRRSNAGDERKALEELNQLLFPKD